MSEKAEALQSLRDATDRFVLQCGRVADAWGYRPHARAWSIGDVAEHVAIANHGIAARLSTLLASPMSGAPAVIDAEIPYLFYQGDEPPNIATPTRSWNALVEVESRFRASVKPLVSWAENVDADLRAYGLPHPIFGVLDGLQWLLFATAHMERHRAQIIGLQRAATQ